jgi:hypothetical protein
MTVFRFTSCFSPAAGNANRWAVKTGLTMEVKHKLNKGQKNILLLLNPMGKLRATLLQTTARALNTLETENYHEFSSVIANEYFSNFGFNDTFKKDLEGLEFLGLIRLLPAYHPSFYFTEVELTEEGKKVADRIANKRQVIFRPSESERSSIFVACAFGHDEIDRLFDEELSPACKKLGYEPIRVDMNEPPRTISELIISAITEAECVIADLSFARPSVYFEVGFAHGLGVPMILTCNSDHYRGKSDDRRVHFDLEQYKISYWSSAGKSFQWKKSMSPYDRLRKIIPKRIEHDDNDR